MEEFEGGLEKLKWVTNDVSYPEAPGIPGTKPSTKGHTWFQPKMWQRYELSPMEWTSNAISK